MKIIIAVILFAASAFGQLTFIAPTTKALTNSKTTLAFNVTGSADIIALQGNIVFDPTVLSPAGANFGCSLGDLTTGFGLYCNEIAPGVIRFSEYCGCYGFDGDGTVLNIRFYTHKGSTDITFDDIMFFNEGGYTETNLTDGFISLQ